jgi:hypothetical protein
VLLRGVVVSHLLMGFEGKEPFGTEINIGNGQTVQWERDKSQRCPLLPALSLRPTPRVSRRSLPRPCAHTHQLGRC